MNGNFRFNFRKTNSSEHQTLQEQSLGQYWLKCSRVRPPIWVALIRALMVPDGCSTVSRRWRMAFGLASSRCCTASRLEHAVVQ